MNSSTRLDALATGYPSLDFITRVSHSPRVGETARLLSIPDSFTFGGCGANIAVGLARLGFKPGLAMVLGDDAEGEQYCRYLAEVGVDTANCLMLPGERTSRSYLFLNPDDQYQNFFFPGAADAWAGELRLEGLERYGCAVMTVGPFEYNRQFVERIVAAGLPLVWIMKADVFSYPAHAIRGFLAASTYVIMNHIEAKYVLKALGKTRVEDLLDPARAIVITRGRSGADVYGEQGMTTVQAVAPAQVVDSTGAGDGFAAGFVAGLRRQLSPEQSAQLGAVVASFVLEAVGCQTNLPDWERAARRYENYFGALRGGHD